MAGKLLDLNEIFKANDARITDAILYQLDTHRRLEDKDSCRFQSYVSMKVIEQ